MNDGGQKISLSFIVAVASLALAVATFWHEINSDAVRQELDHEHRLTQVETTVVYLKDRQDRMADYMKGMKQ